MEQGFSTELSLLINSLTTDILFSDGTLTETFLDTRATNSAM